MSILAQPRSTVLVINHRKPLQLGAGSGGGVKTDQDVTIELGRLLAGGSQGNLDNVMLFPSTTGAAQRAAAQLVLSAASGAVGVVVGPTGGTVSLTATAAGGDANTAGLVAGVVNASVNALVLGLIGASNLVGSVTLASVLANSRFNIGDLAFRAVNGLTPAPVNGTIGLFDMSGTDAQDATSLAAAINGHPANMGRYIAIAVSNVVYVTKTAVQVQGVQTLVAATNREQLSTDVATMTLAQIAASARCTVYALQPGALGNHTSISATGTGATMANAATALSAGAGGNVTTWRRATP